MSKAYGIDVSHHQAPASLNWAKMAQTSSFAMVRGSYGLLRDERTAEHVKLARAAGLAVGCYHFFRISQSVPDQLAVFRAQLELAGIGVGDIVPALDVEADPLPKATAVSPAWQDGVRYILDALVEQFGDALVYITQREFGMLGKPAWLLERPLWVAHYTGASKPASPGNVQPTIWQHRVGPYDPDGAGGYDSKNPLLDQNRLLEPLPLIGTVKAVAPSVLPQPHTEPDHGLEELLAQLHGQSWERIQDGLGLAGQNQREFDSADTDPSDLAPDSEPYANER